MMPNPPQKIVNVMICLLSLLGHKNVGWKDVKKFFTNTSVISKIIEQDPQNISDKDYHFVVDFMEQNESSFETISIYRASKVAGPIS